MSSAEFGEWVELTIADRAAQDERDAADAQPAPEPGKPGTVTCICPDDAFLPDCPLHGMG